MSESTKLRVVQYCGLESSRRQFQIEYDFEGSATETFENSTWVQHLI